MVPQKVVFLVTHPSAGGVQELWVNLAEGFRARGHEVRLMALYPARGREMRETPADIPWHCLAPAKPRVAPILLLRLARAFRRLQPDIVFTAMPFANVLAPIAASIAGGRARIVTSHHSPADTHGRWLDRIDAMTGSRGRVRAIVSVSDSVKASLAGKPAAYLAKCVTIHNALPPRIEELIGELAPRGPRRPSGQGKVIATGRLSAQKNYETLLMAARHLPEFTITIVGSGPDEAKLKALVQTLGIADRIRFLGQRPREETLTLLANADVFVQPSLFEGHSLGLIEAARLGLPLIVSTADTQLEGITAANGERCGVAVATLDDVQLAQAIREVLGDSQVFAAWSSRAQRLGMSVSYQKMLGAYEAFLPR